MKTVNNTEFRFVIYGTYVAVRLEIRKNVSTFFRANADEGDDVGMVTDGLHDLHLLQEVQLLLLGRVLLRRLDGHDDGAVVAANVLSLRFPDL